MTGNPDDRPLLNDLLSKAAGRLQQKEIDKYLRLRSFVTDGMIGDRPQFEGLFSAYYGLNSAGLTREFKSAYFQFLYEHRPMESLDPHSTILRSLYQIRRHQGDRIVAASFVSKLVAIHDETQPLFDRYIQAFFGLGVPTVGPVDFRIAGFVLNLRQIRRTYQTWSQMLQFAPIIEQVKFNYVGLADVHAHRIWDFLAWEVGSYMTANSEETK